TASDIADFGYSSAVRHDDAFAQMTTREKITYKPIDSIYPNQIQPRRVIPSALRHFFATPDTDKMAYGFQQWLKEIELERRGSTFPLNEYLTGEKTSRTEGIDRTDEELEQI